MIYKSTRLGSIEVQDKEIISFSDGIYAFENEKSFALIPLNPSIESPLEWMHSLQTPDLAFVVTDPYLYVPDYKLHLTEDDKKKILLEAADPMAVRVIVKIPKNYAEMTANLLAPIVINIRKRSARQFVLTTLEYEVAHYLLPKEVRLASKINA
ncbi:MAG: flagellar assembly protein FliW [Nitrospinae bacterium RIFCSPLOWO2_12_FULL_47_7]|nr:MAG: flagellar assembly protein FliW [Nitrospinae bacterium RIFCSPLOWO2_12_FULL_47_7]